MTQTEIGHPNINEFFHFDQRYLRNPNYNIGKGLCFGISFCLLSHLIFKRHSDILCPEMSFNFARIYIDKLRHSFSHDDKSMYQYIIKKQQRESQDDYLRLSENVSINEQNGYGILSMVRIDNDNNRSSHPGYHYNSYKSQSNHVGVIVWDSSKLFIFEPNCGGLLYHSICGALNKEMFPQLVDSLIDNMYRRASRDGHSRIKEIHRPNNLRHYLTNVAVKTGLY
ncbi:hypothetical protein [Xenorhabdus doucetiae]|nr:hypothetical protein [Xenorhabdus doucetiae]